MNKHNKKIKTIALVAPCGNIKNFDDINDKIKILEKNNFKIKKFYNEKAQNNYLSDSDKNRKNYLEKAFLDDETDLVLNIRGGFGAIRIVDLIDYNLIKNSNKFYASSSDGSILLASISTKTNIKCFHSLMLTNGFIDSLDKNIKIIENNIFNIKLEKINTTQKNTNTLSKPIKGRLWGGNLSSIVSMFSGKLYLPDDDIILFLEDLNEPMYKIDKMLYEIYRNQKLKEKIKGIIFGDFYFKKEEILPLLNQYTLKFNVECYITDDITHKNNNVTIPYGNFIELT